MLNLCPACLSDNESNALTCASCGYGLRATAQQDIHHLESKTILVSTQSKHQYQIENTLGVGGFGITYRGIDLAQQKPVAIK